MAAVDLHLPPGFRFHPTDEELVVQYLCRKCASMSISVPIIADIDLYKYDPWELPGLAMYGEKEWYYFSPRDRKYPNGSRPNRAAGSGYWKATGADKPIGHPKPVGIKKALVFYTGKAPKGDKTNWIMHEYRLADVDRSARRKKNNSLRLDDWVLCRLYNKKGAIKQPRDVVGYRKAASDVASTDEDTKPAILSPVPEESPMVYDDFMYLDPESDVLSPEVESAPMLSAVDWLKFAPDFPFGYIDGGGGGARSLFEGSYPEAMQDVVGYVSKPF